MKMATKVGMYLTTHESVTVARGAWAEIGKIMIGLRTNQIAGFVTVPSKKNKYLYLFYKFPVLSPGVSINQGTNPVPTESSLCHNFGIDKSFLLIPLDVTPHWFFVLSQLQQGNFYLKDWLRFESQRVMLINFQICVLLCTAARFYTSIELVDHRELKVIHTRTSHRLNSWLWYESNCETLMHWSGDSLKS